MTLWQSNISRALGGGESSNSLVVSGDLITHLGSKVKNNHIGLVGGFPRVTGQPNLMCAQGPVMEV